MSIDHLSLFCPVTSSFSLSTAVTTRALWSFTLSFDLEGLQIHSAQPPAARMVLPSVLSILKGPSSTSRQNPPQRLMPGPTPSTNKLLLSNKSFYTSHHSKNPSSSRYFQAKPQPNNYSSQSFLKSLRISNLFKQKGNTAHTYSTNFFSLRRDFNILASFVLILGFVRELSVSLLSRSVVALQLGIRLVQELLRLLLMKRDYTSLV